MISKGPARTFTREAVEAWLFRLTESDWEKFIDKENLHRGRSYYRDGAISTIDVQSGQIIVTQKINRVETYSVIEWENKKPEIRTSSHDESFGISLGAAGLYEIEELVAEVHDEDPLLEHVSNIEPEKHSEDTEGSDAKANVNDDQPAVNEIAPVSVSIEICSKNGLTATPFWITSKSKRTKVYSKENHFDSSSTDRPTLMSFIAESGKVGFSFEKKKGLFRLKEWKKIAQFTDKILPSWESIYKIELIGEAKLLRHGKRKLSWEIEARSRDNDEMSLREAFKLGSLRLGIEQSKKLLKTNDGSAFITGHGFVQIENNQLEDFKWWQKNRGDTKRANWPRYMLFSLFARKYLKARPDGNLSKWRESIKQASKKQNSKRFTFLRPYQKDGVSHLNTLHKLGCHGLLADEMGLGKTIQTLAIIEEGKTCQYPDIVICPASVVPVWIKESKERFPKIKTKILNKESNFSKEPKNFLWIASYTQLRRHRHLLGKIKFRYAVLDEAQLIKNPKAKVTQACLSIEAQNRLALSGTPIENSALDLWTIFRFLMPGLLGGRKEMENELSLKPDETAQLIRKQITPFVLRRLKKEVATELPPKIENEISCVLNENQRNEYKQIAEGAIKSHGNNLQLAMKERPTHVFSLLTRLRQVCCDPALLPWNENKKTTSAKTELLLDKLSDLSSTGSKVIVFSQFTSFLKILKVQILERMPKLKLFELTGETKDRKLPVQGFENHKESAVILASLKAAGLGVTLKSADYVFLMDPWWNPAIEEQAIDRAHRIGRTKPTFIYRLVTKGTVEERVQNLQNSKKEIFQKIIGDIDRPSGLADHFSTLRDLVDLTEE